MGRDYVQSAPGRCFDFYRGHAPPLPTKGGRRVCVTPNYRARVWRARTSISVPT